MFSSLILLSCIFIQTHAVDVRDFGAKGDATTDDTEAIIAAVRGADDGVVEFSRGNYRITRTIEIILAGSNRISLSGKGGTARIIMEGEGPAFFIKGSHDGSAAYSSVSSVTWEKERMALIEDLEITGKNPKADGIRFEKAFMPVLKSVLIRDVHNAIHFTERQRNIIITGCHIYHCSGIGIYLDSVNIHQVIIGNNHISFCLRGGIKVKSSEIRNFQITGNDIEYNFDLDQTESADVWFDCSRGGSVREGTISGNTIQALPSPGGANIRFKGNADDLKTIGLWSVTGNHISDQEVNIHLENTRGISITGNTFIIATDRNLVLENSRNIIVSANVFDHNDDYYRRLTAPGGIHVSKGRDIILSDNIIEKAGFGTEKSGGAIVIEDSEGVSVQGCHVINPKYRGILIVNTSNSHVTGCIINEDSEGGEMISPVEAKGKCPGTVIDNNQYGSGKAGDIISSSKEVLISGNRKISRSTN